MSPEKKIKISAIYSVSLSALTIYFGFYYLIGYIIPVTPAALSLVSLTSLYALIALKFKMDRFFVVSYTLIFFLMSLGIMLSSSEFMRNSGDFMSSFILFLISALLLSGFRGTYQQLYNGFSMYLVGVFLLISYAGIEIIILLANVLDYYIQCLGEHCATYPLAMKPEFILFILGLMATYPYFAREKFRRCVNDKKGTEYD